MPSYLFIFFPTVTDRFFFPSYSSSSSSSLYILSNSLTSFFLSTKPSALLLFLHSHNLILSSFLKLFHLFQTLSSSPMAPKSKTKKTSYVISGDVFNLTHWNGDVWLNESPLLVYRPQDHLSEGAKMSKFFKLFSFSSSILIFRFNPSLEL